MVKLVTIDGNIFRLNESQYLLNYYSFYFFFFCLLQYIKVHTGLKVTSVTDKMLPYANVSSKENTFEFYPTGKGSHNCLERHKQYGFQQNLGQ